MRTVPRLHHVMMENQLSCLRLQENTVQKRHSPLKSSPNKISLSKDSDFYSEVSFISYLHFLQTQFECKHGLNGSKKQKTFFYKHGLEFN
jgi:hypothetical protein